MTRALILAAGQGNRLRPLTSHKPKCLVPLLGKTLLERQISTLRQSGIEKIQIVTGYCSEQIEKLGFSTSFNARYADTNMVATLFSAIEFIKASYEVHEDLVVAYGDIVYQKNNLQALMRNEDEISLMVDSKWENLWRLRFQNPLDDAETLVLDEYKYLVELGKKTNKYESIQGQYTGLIKVRSDKILALIDFYNKLNRNGLYDGEDFDNMYMTSFLQLLIDIDWKIKAVEVKNGWLEVDTVEDLSQYEDLAKNGTLSQYYQIEL